MLYSVVICDILYKLQELKDMYNDTSAERILKEIEKCRVDNDNKSKSKWEKELLDKIYNDTHLLDMKAYTDINHLYDYRNFSAHPAMNDNYVLISPTKEETIALIRNMLDDVLVKPPVFIKSIVSLLTEDLSEKKDLYVGEYENLSAYLNSKYFNHMTITMLKLTYKTFWKFCFNLPDDENCRKNKIINRQAIQIMFEHSPVELLEFMKQDSAFQSTSSQSDCVMQLVVFLSKFPNVYKVLSIDTKLQIDFLIENKPNAKLISWFKTDKKKHVKILLGSNSNDDFGARTLEYTFEQYKNEGLQSEILEYYIKYFGLSYNYDNADKRYSDAISPFIKYISRKQAIELIEIINCLCRRILSYNSRHIMSFSSR